MRADWTGTCGRRSCGSSSPEHHKRAIHGARRLSKSACTNADVECKFVYCLANSASLASRPLKTSSQLDPSFTRRSMSALVLALIRACGSAQRQAESGRWHNRRVRRRIDDQCFIQSGVLDSAKSRTASCKRLMPNRFLSGFRLASVLRIRSTPTHMTRKDLPVHLPGEAVVMNGTASAREAASAAPVQSQAAMVVPVSIRKPANSVDRFIEPGTLQTSLPLTG